MSMVNMNAFGDMTKVHHHPQDKRSLQIRHHDRSFPPPETAPIEIETQSTKRYKHHMKRYLIKKEISIMGSMSGANR